MWREGVRKGEGREKNRCSKRSDVQKGQVTKMSGLYRKELLGKKSPAWGVRDEGAGGASHTPKW